MNRNVTHALAAAVVTAVCLSTGSAKQVERTEPQRYLSHIKALASPEMQGRGAGTQGIEKARHYIESEFRRLGLKPAGPEGSWTQALQVTTGAKPGSGNHLSLKGTDLHFGRDYQPISFSSSGKVTGPLVFAGYGITAPEFGYDDYAHLDVKDKIVVVLRYEPKHFRKDEGRRKGEWTRHASLSSKAINARNHGARAVLLVQGSQPSNGTELIKFGATAGPEDVGILMVQVLNSIVTDWFADAGKSLVQVQKDMEAKSVPESFSFPDNVPPR